MLASFVLACSNLGPRRSNSGLTLTNSYVRETLTRTLENFPENSRKFLLQMKLVLKNFSLHHSDSPVDMIEMVRRSDRVHPIRSDKDLKNRLADNRRYFHPQTFILIFVINYLLFFHPQTFILLFVIGLIFW